MRKQRFRGSVAVELGISMPIFMIVVCGGLSLGRAMITKHNLESAVTHATRAAAIAGQISEGVIHNAINQRLGNERINCASLRTQVQVIPSGIAGTPNALQVTTTCELAPMFTGLLNFGVERVTAVAAMPLPID